MCKHSCTPSTEAGALDGSTQLTLVAGPGTGDAGRHDLAGLGAQQEVWRQDHYWGGVAVTLLMLLSLAARQEILRDLRWRRLHITVSVVAVLLFLAQGITGSRDLLEIPLSWQKPAVYACDFTAKVCPAPNSAQN